MNLGHFVARLAFALALTAVAAASAAMAETGPAPAAAVDGRIALDQIPAATGAAVVVTSPAFGAGGDIPFENTQYRGNIFPGLSWTPGPKGTRAYVIIMQDSDAHRAGAPILHWTMFDIPASVTRLEAGMSVPPAGASYGPNIRGPNQPYMGPHTPPGPKHHYHFQVFALDTALPSEAGAGFEALTQGMRGHVLAAGELVGLAQADPNAPPRPPPAVR